MKSINMKFFTLLLLSMTVIVFSCKDEFLETDQLGSITEAQVATPRGVETLLIGTYAVLDGVILTDNTYGASGSNWVWGGVASDDAHKGSEAGDQADINPIERYEAPPTNPYLNYKWRSVYEGVARANNTLKVLALVEEIDEVTRTKITAEARFLRGHYHFEAKKMWNNVPYVDETVVYGEEGANVGNKEDNNAEMVWTKIEEDFKYAYENLKETGMDVGRANKWAAASYLAKAYIFQQKYDLALPLLTEIINNGQTPLGEKYDLMKKYGDNFNAETGNGPESVFAIQASVQDGGSGFNSNFGDVLNFPHPNGPGGCCGFYQPSTDLVNAFRTDANGLPMPDQYREELVLDEDDLALSDDAFVPYGGNLDPRLDWTVGRRGIPYLGWGPHPGQPYIRLVPYGGPFSPKKNVYTKEQEGALTDPSFWAKGLTAINYHIIRFANVLLWAAEAEANASGGSLDKATEYVNRVRNRAANPEGFVTFEDGNPAPANYMIAPYPTSFTSTEEAMEAIRFETRLELAMEGHRFFDLVRWGIAGDVLNDYLDYESQFRSYLEGAEFTEGQDEYWPIPQRQIDLQADETGSALKQNPGYVQ